MDSNKLDAAHVQSIKNKLRANINRRRNNTKNTNQQSTVSVEAFLDATAGVEKEVFELVRESTDAVRESTIAFRSTSDNFKTILEDPV